MSGNGAGARPLTGSVSVPGQAPRPEPPAGEVASGPHLESPPSLSFSQCPASSELCVGDRSRCGSWAGGSGPWTRRRAGDGQQPLSLSSRRLLPRGAAGSGPLLLELLREFRESESMVALPRPDTAGLQPTEGSVPRGQASERRQDAVAQRQRGECPARGRPPRQGLVACRIRTDSLKLDRSGLSPTPPPQPPPVTLSSYRAAAHRVRGLSLRGSQPRGCLSPRGSPDRQKLPEALDQPRQVCPACRRAFLSWPFPGRTHGVPRA